MYNFSADEMLSMTKFAVEANSFESLSLWKEKDKYNPGQLSWYTYRMGYLLTLGTVTINRKKMPVCVSVQWIEVYGQIVMLYHTTSQIVDYRMIDKWLKKYKIPSTDAMNFANCVHAMRELKAKSASVQLAPV